MVTEICMSLLKKIGGRERASLGYMYYTSLVFLLLWLSASKCYRCTFVVASQPIEMYLKENPIRMSGLLRAQVR